jgi:hypothetical protein
MGLPDLADVYEVERDEARKKAAALEAENKRLREEVKRLKEIVVEDLRHRLFLTTEERDRLKARLDLLRAMASEIRWERVVDFCVRERLVADGNLLSQLAKALRESEGGGDAEAKVDPNVCECGHHEGNHYFEMDTGSECLVCDCSGFSHKPAGAGEVRK